MMCDRMADPTLFVVGVPGMGNAEPSWHQVLLQDCRVGSSLMLAYLQIRR